MANYVLRLTLLRHIQIFLFKRGGEREPMFEKMPPCVYFRIWRVTFSYLYKLNFNSIFSIERGSNGNPMKKLFWRVYYYFAGVSKSDVMKRLKFHARTKGIPIEDIKVPKVLIKDLKGLPRYE